MVFKDLEGTKQAQKELAEKEYKILLSLQGSKPSKPNPEPKPNPLLEMINVGIEDYKQFEALFKDEIVMSGYDNEVEILMDIKSPAYMAYKKKMTKFHKRKLLKSLLKKHVNKPLQLSMVDNSLTDEQVDEMILTCLKLEQAKGKLSGMPDTEPFGHEFGY